MRSRTLLLISVLSLALSASLSAQAVVAVNGASFRVDQVGVVSTGAFATAFPPTGTTFAGVTAPITGTLPYQTTLGGVTVAVDGTNVPVQYVGPASINFLVPYAMSPGLKTLKVTSPGGTLDGTLRIIAAAPGLFFVFNDPQTPPAGRVLNQDGFTVNTSTETTKRGDVISIFGTGPGTFDHALTDGVASGSTLVRTVSIPQVFIGGVEARVEFSGLNPAYPGLWQVNAVVPTQSFIAGRVPIIVYVDGIDSNEVTIFVQ